MVWFVLAHVVSFVVDLVLVAVRRPDRDKDLEILLLRHQLRLLERRAAPAAATLPLGAAHPSGPGGEGLAPRRWPWPPA